MLGLLKYKTQRSDIAYALTWVGMVVILISGAILFVSMPTWFYRKPYVNFNPVPSIFLAILLFVLGYWLTCIFPAIKITDTGIRCKRMYFYKSVKWSEMENMVEFKNGTMALTIKRKGWPLLNGLFFEWLTSRALRIKDPLILFVPEFFGSDKTIPQEIIANTPATSGVNAYLSEKINGIGFINPSRFSIRDSDKGVLITIPGKKNILEVVFFVPMAMLWSYFVGYMIYIFALINLGGILALFQNAWDSRTYFIFAIMDIFTFLFISFILLWIWVVIASTTRHMAGKEVIDVSGQSLTITKQIFKWKRQSKFSPDTLKNLRVNVIKPRLLTALYQALQSSLGRNGIIVFDFDGKTVRFGLELTEDEGSYILAAIKSRMNM
jgi:hypothetical protein